MDRTVSGLRLAALLLLGGLAACTERELILPGEREGIRPEVTSAVAEDRAIPALSVPAPRTNSDWGHLNGNAAHLAPSVALPVNLNRIWSVDLGQGAARRVRLISAPVVSGGRIFAMDAANQLTAVSAAGGVLWRTDLSRVGEGGTEGFGGGLAARGDILVATTGFGEVLRVDPATGAEIWRSPVEGAVRAAPTLADDKVIVVARGDLGYGLDLATGEIDWRIEGIGQGAGLIGGSSPAVRGPLAVLPFQSGEIRATLVRNGLTVWTAAVTGGRRDLARAIINDISGDPVIDNDVVYAANQAGRIVALDRRDGTRLWTQQDGSYGPALVVGNAIFVVSDTAELVRIDAVDGASVWRRPLPAFRNPDRRRVAIPHYGPLLAGGRLIVASGDGVLRSFDPTNGTPLGDVTLPGAVTAQPAIANATLYVVTENGSLHALR
ncbi:MAG: PQQ-binding-like beta-propeller repeat protein [Pseudomonadota bacterium]